MRKLFISRISAIAILLVYFSIVFFSEHDVYKNLGYLEKIIIILYAISQFILFLWVSNKLAKVLIRILKGDKNER